MNVNLKKLDIGDLKPRITIFGVGGAGGNAVNNMINAGLQGVDFVVANTDAQSLTMSRAERIIQMGVQATEGLGAGSQPDVGAICGIGDMPVNEALGILAQIFICIEGSLQDLRGDVRGHVPGPALRGIEGDDAESVAVLAGQEIADDGLAIGLGGIGLVIGDAELTMVVQDSR
jgi:hypothetical protein